MAIYLSLLFKKQWNQDAVIKVDENWEMVVPKHISMVN
jgi:hypothetical protein